MSTKSTLIYLFPVLRGVLQGEEVDKIILLLISILQPPFEEIFPHPSLAHMLVFEGGDQTIQQIVGLIDESDHEVDCLFLIRREIREIGDIGESGGLP